MAGENTNIFIAGLPAGLEDEKLKSIFEAYGTVTWCKVMPSKGKDTEAGLVEFATVAEAKWVVENLNGNIAEGLENPIEVAFKRDHRNKGAGKGYGKDYGKGYGKDYGKGYGKGYGKDYGKSYGKGKSSPY